jgi:hypothetical protein
MVLMDFEFHLLNETFLKNDQLFPIINCIYIHSHVHEQLTFTGYLQNSEHVAKQNDIFQ